MLNNSEIKKIEDFVSIKPRSVQEIAQHLNKNWRTIDRYIQQIKEEYGTIETRTFREGTRGALKIVYWASIEKAQHTIFQQRLEEEIFRIKNKDEFSSFDIFQYVPDKDKEAIIEREISEDTTNLKELVDLLNKTKNELLLFSGNLSWVNLKKGKIDIFKILENLTKKGVKIKVVCRVDIAGKSNIEKMLSLNFKNGKELVEIHHVDQPIRGIIFVRKFFRLKEIKEPTGRIKELDKKIYIFYTIKNKEWSEWISHIFWKMFNKSLTAENRLKEMAKLYEKKN